MATQKSEYAVVLVVSDNPGKAGRDSVAAMQRRLDAVGPGLAPAQVGIHHRHVNRLGADGLHGFGPAVRRDPLEAVSVESPESENTFGWDGSEEQMSQNGPYLSQKGP